MQIRQSADYGPAVRMDLESHAEKSVGESRAGAILALFPLRLHHLRLFFQQSRIQPGQLHELGEDREAARDPRGRQNRVIDRMVARGKAVDRSAQLLHLRGDFSGAAPGRAVEENVFQQMGRADFFRAFIRAAGFDPELESGQGREGIPAHDDAQPVLKGERLRGIVGGETRPAKNSKQR